MADNKDMESKSLDPAVQEMLALAESMPIKTVWDRYQDMQPQCGFGDTGLCCRHCLQGPCRIGIVQLSWEEDRLARDWFRIPCYS